MNNIQLGDTVKIAENNYHHLGDKCAYNGFKGIVTDVYEDGGFCIKGEEGVLVVPLNRDSMWVGDIFIPETKGVWIYLNGKLIYHKRIYPKPIKKDSIINKLLNIFN